MIERPGASDETQRRSQIVGDIIVRLRGWLGAPLPRADSTSVARSIPAKVPQTVDRIGPLLELSSGRQNSENAHAQRNWTNTVGQTVVALPLSRRQQLTQLAHHIRKRFGDAEACPDDPLLLTVSSVPLQRLCIDSSSYIEVFDDRASYRVVLGHEFETRVILETPSVDLAENFVLQYLLLTREEVCPAEGIT